ncbi:hypothetical protein [Ligilactobacillus equi]|nr:hypothetical protein [Ligilactobacillus equi]
MAIRKNKPWLHGRFSDRQRLSTILKKIKEYNYYTKLQKGLKAMYSHEIDKRLTQKVITELMDDYKNAKYFVKHHPQGRNHPLAQAIIKLIDDTLATLNDADRAKYTAYINGVRWTRVTLGNAENLALAIQDLTGVCLIVYNNQDYSQTTQRIKAQLLTLLNGYTKNS